VKEREYDVLWRDRESRYPDAQPLPSSRPVHIKVDPGYAATYAGQVAAITAASLLGRMTKSVAVQVPSVSVVAPLPWSGLPLDEVVMQTLHAAHPYGCYEERPAVVEDLCLSIGPTGDGLVIHGSGWAAYCGSEPSPLVQSEEVNPFGAAFAVIAAASQLQLNPQFADFTSAVVDTYLWRPGLPAPGVPEMSADLKFGELWCVGAGSVGSCSLFFLSLATSAFQAVLVDRDTVGVENVTRSALYSWRDALAQVPKVEAAGRWLHRVGIEDIELHIAWLDEISGRWLGRQPGTPDVLISAANERNVRAEIESGYPPLQVYATTGRNWQATLLRHIPVQEPCSLCVPGGRMTSAPLLCATGAPTLAGDSAGEDDVALPFLSYGAGLMTAAEIAKLALNRGAATSNRVLFEPRTPNLVQSVRLTRKHGCMCEGRDDSTHAKVIRGSRFAALSDR
jgi:hypothetical protein